MPLKSGMRVRSSQPIKKLTRGMRARSSQPIVKKSTKSTIKSKNVHKGIVCDKCDGDIYGYRYKCKECSDYDLCFQCKKEGNHSQHIFIRIASN